MRKLGRKCVTFVLLIDRHFNCQPVLVRKELRRWIAGGPGEKPLRASKPLELFDRSIDLRLKATDPVDNRDNSSGNPSCFIANHKVMAIA